MAKDVDKGGLLYGNFPIYRLVVLLAALALALFVGIGIGQAWVNQRYLSMNITEVVQTLCRTSRSADCVAARAKLDPYPIK